MYRPTPPFRASVSTHVHLALHFSLVLVSGGLGVAISTLVDTTTMRLAIFIKICWHWATRLYLMRSGGRRRGPVGVLPATLTIVGRNNSHQFLILSKNLMYYLCSSCCDWWCWTFVWGTVQHLCFKRSSEKILK